MKGPAVLITGCHGRVGSILVNQAPVKFTIVGSARERDSLLKDRLSEYIQHDITDRRLTKDLILSLKPRFIINSAAIANVDMCETERELCWRVNVEGTENIVSSAKKIGAKFIHLSTDFVFDGQKKEAYLEDDRTNPINYYGKSKLAAENLIKASGVDYAIIRTASVVNAPSIKDVSCFAVRMINAMRTGEKIPVASDELRNPAYVSNLCRGIWKLIHLDRSGVFHMSGSESITRYEFGLRLAEKFNLNAELLQPVLQETIKTTAKRPLRTVLSVEKAHTDLCFDFYDVDQCLNALKDDLKSGAER